METKTKLNLEDGESLDDIGHYQRLVGKLINLTITGPDITYVVSMVSQFMHAPCTSHLDAIDRILRYLKGTPGQDWVGSCDRKSTYGFCTSFYYDELTANCQTLSDTACAGYYGDKTIEEVQQIYENLAMNSQENTIRGRKEIYEANV
eukprot:XP_015581109.1 uncharacterized protein LOC107262079 [Ricinus communis]